uniref:Serine incorporator n=1 Tax=Globisporangium ultimum (strain ATCC 200006 / CBS 805.95 / DAOM BR144) TaxID=431595 RepID=K3X843_GLOUD
MARPAYVTLFFVNAIVAALLREFGKTFLLRFSYVFGFFKECEEEHAGEYCIGNQLVYRMSFSMGCFFLMTGLLSCAAARGCENVCCLTLFQIPFYFGMLFCSLFIPNSFFNGYADVARIASAAFMILQIIIILDYAYNARDFILDKMDEAGRDDDARQALLDTSYETIPQQSYAKTIWEVTYLAIVVGTTVAATIAIVIMYKKYAGCDLNTAFITITVLSCIALTFMSVTSWVNAGLLPASAFTGYAVFLCYQAVHANPDPACSSVDPSTVQHQTKSIALNAALAAFTITWTSWRMSMTKTNLFSLSSSSSSSSLSNDLKTEEAATTGSKGDKNEQLVVPEYQFHALIFLASFYMAMVITNWGSSNGLASEGDEFVTMCVKIGSQWVAIALFLWTLIAPSKYVFI